MKGYNGAVKLDQERLCLLVTGTKRRFKQFDISSLSNALLVLGTLITSCIVNIYKFEEYAVEAIALQERFDKAGFIPAKEYDDVYDKILLRQREILMYMADEAKDVFSYKATRKKFKSMKFISRELSPTVNEILNEMHVIRNATFHNVQSHLVAETETMTRTVAQKLMPRATLKPQINPLIITVNQAYTKEMLRSLVEHNKIRLAQFKIVLDEMKTDYQDMYDQLPNHEILFHPGLKDLVEDCTSQTPVKYIYREIIFGKIGNEPFMPSLSFAIQKGKYDGTEESYKKHTDEDVLNEDKR